MIEQAMVVALFVSLSGNVIQMIFYCIKIWGDYYKFKEGIELRKRTESYQDLDHDNQEGAIYF